MYVNKNMFKILIDYNNIYIHTSVFVVLSLRITLRKIHKIVFRSVGMMKYL